MIDEVSAEHPQMSIKRLCKLFGVSRSWYCARPSSLEQKVSEEEVPLRDAIEQLVFEFPSYGYRRVTEALRRQGWTINHKKVLRVMRNESLLCQLKRRFRPTTDSAHPFKRYPNLIKDAKLTGPDQGWVADITYVRLPTTFCYLASILDDFSRYCVGWALSRWIDTRLTLKALEMALSVRRPDVGLIHHSDQGVQYASGEYISRLQE
jgi:putative transposase